jgi:hypothetical protein
VALPRRASRRTNLALLILLGMAFATGLVGYGVGTPAGSRIVAVAHGIAGFGLVVLGPWKRIIISRGWARGHSTPVGWGCWCSSRPAWRRRRSIVTRRDWVDSARADQSARHRVATASSDDHATRLECLTREGGTPRNPGCDHECFGTAAPHTYRARCEGTLRPCLIATWKLSSPSLQRRRGRQRRQPPRRTR